MTPLFRPKIIPQEQSIKKPFFFGVTFVLVAGAVLAVSYFRLPPQVPLFFSNPWGESQLVAPLFLGLPLFLSLVLLVANSIFAQLISDYPFLRRVLIISAATSSLLAAITVIRIIILLI